MRSSLPPLALLSLTTLGAPPTLPPFAPPLRCSTIALPLAARADVVIGSRGVWDELLTSAVAGIVRAAQNASAASKLVVEQSATAGKAYMVHETADGAAYHGASPRLEPPTSHARPIHAALLDPPTSLARPIHAALLACSPRGFRSPMSSAEPTQDTACVILSLVSLRASPSKVSHGGLRLGVGKLRFSPRPAKPRDVFARRGEKLT